MKKIVSTTWLVLLLLSVNAQTIPADRRVDWQQITNDYTYKTPVKAVSIMDFDGVAAVKKYPSGDVAWRIYPGG